MMQQTLEPLNIIPESSFHERLFQVGWLNGDFSDVEIKAFNISYRAHKILLCQSPFFEKLLRGPWKEASSPVLKLDLDDPHIGPETLECVLQYLYGKPVEINDENVYGTLALSSFLGLDTLCAKCVTYAMNNLNLDTFKNLYYFSKNYNYGESSHMINMAILDFLRIYGYKEAKDILFHLEEKDLFELLCDDVLWIPTELHRFQLILEICLKRSQNLDFCKPVFTEAIHYDTIPLIKISSLKKEIMDEASLDENVKEIIFNALNTVQMKYFNNNRYVTMSSHPSNNHQSNHNSIHSIRLLNPFLKNIDYCSEQIPLSIDFTPLFRVGIEFSSISDIYKTKGLDSNEFYYAGSLWWLKIVQRRPNLNYIGSKTFVSVFIHRREAPSNKWQWTDKRDTLKAWVRFRVGCGASTIDRACEGIFFF